LVLPIVVALVAGCQSAPERRSVDDVLEQVVSEQIAARRETAPPPATGVQAPENGRGSQRNWAAGFPPSHGAASSTDQVGLPQPRRLPPITADAAPASYATVASYQNPVGDDPFPGAAAAPRTPRPPAGPLPPAVAPDEPRVTEMFEETDVRQAVQALAVQANASVVLDEQVSGFTSAVIENEPFELALRKVLLPVGCVYRKYQGQYLIGVNDPQTSLFPLIAERCDYTPQHLSPEELSTLLPERFQKFLRVVDKRNRIVIEAPAETAQRILFELQRADQPIPQVVLEVLVCVMSPEIRRRFGFDLEQGVRVDADTLQSLKLEQLAFSGTIGPAALGDLFSDFAVTSHFLQCLAQEGYVNIRATPRVMAKDGEKAEISIGRESYFSVQPMDVEFFYRQEIEKVEAGITLEILPVIRGDNVTVTIERAEVSEDVRGYGSGVELASPYPLINRRKVTTTVHVKDGQTIVIGGLNQTQLVDRIDKVPVLGDIPGIRWLFRRVEKQEKETEVVIFISPRIVRTPEAAEYGPLEEVNFGRAAVGGGPLDKMCRENCWPAPQDVQTARRLPVPGRQEMLR
jgi:type II secretory pathway component GspD/PulD (secretin)